MLRGSMLSRSRRSLGPLIARPVSQAALSEAYRQLLDASPFASGQPQASAIQERAVELAVQGYSVFLHLPTGAGKSLAFQAPALVAPSGSTTLVVSPLIALIHDQVASLKRKGVQAIQLPLDRRKPRTESLESLLCDQRLVYTTPEFMLQNAEMQQWLRAAANCSRIDRVVLDEAHCIFEWGNSFRPSYLELARWKAQAMPEVPITLATASIMEDDIKFLATLFNMELVLSSEINQLIPDAVSSTARTPRSSRLLLVQHQGDRPNLSLKVLPKPRQSPSLITKQVGDSPTIVYCLTRKEAEETCLALVRLGCHAGVYHGGLSRKRREFVRKQWMMNRLSIICATSAFGMGIDRQDVRFVVHHSIPLSLSAYLQQIGRAGRDGKHATCLLLYSPNDKGRAENLFIDRGDDDSGSVVSRGNSDLGLAEVIAFCEFQEGRCRKNFLYSHFGIPFDRRQCNCGCNCAVPPEVLEANAAEQDAEDDWAISNSKPDHAQDKTQDDDTAPAKVEYYYQRVLAHSRKLRLPKREALSRRVVKAVLSAGPISIDELAAMKGVGRTKAQLYFAIFKDNTTN